MRRSTASVLIFSRIVIDFSILGCSWPPAQLLHPGKAGGSADRPTANLGARGSKRPRDRAVFRHPACGTAEGNEGFAQQLARNPPGNEYEARAVVLITPIAEVDGRVDQVLNAVYRHRPGAADVEKPFDA